MEQLTQKIRDQLEESITEKVARQLMLSLSQMQSQFQSQMQSQGLALPPEPEIGPSATHVSTKESCVAPSRNDPNTGDLDKYELYVEENPPCLVALGRFYEGSTTIHNIPLLHDQVKVGVEEVKDVDARILVPTEEVKLVGQAPNTFFACLTHLVKRLSEQVMWDATVFGVFNENFPLYIKHEDLSEIAHDGQCLSISIIQLWILPDNYLKGIINSALKGLDDTPQSKSKANTRWIVVKVEGKPIRVFGCMASGPIVGDDGAKEKQRYTESKKPASLGIESSFVQVTGNTSMDSAEKRLNELGYKQELRREMTMFKTLAISFSTMTLFTGITPLYGSSLQYAGPATLVWGWIVVSFFTWFVGIAMVEICSSFSIFLFSQN
ncbi:hypothetical protein D0Y65_034390 [Glycine soja]|uniref:Uncharacterized protein n=1 Tax=Glycine soja TaxID=3848 RepID=A0A445HQ81_GLYSO|nr:hypothetical protein D0Y65_034390 [Glycine soja]